MPTHANQAKGRRNRKASSGVTPRSNLRRKKTRGGTPGKTKKQKTIGGTEFRFVTAKLYGEDAKKADWVAEHANLTDLVTSSVRLIHATLQKFFNRSLPDYYSTPKIKLRHMDETHQLMVDVQTDIYQQYIEADRSIEEKFGKSSGPEFLMSLAIQRENPADIADEYLAALIDQFSTLKPTKE
jgi:hypothetical protein